MFVFSLQRLVDCHDKVKKLLKIHRPLELSMGMSGDYEHAVSTKCRVITLENLPHYIWPL